MTLLEMLKQQGKALVLQGSEGCGKTLLAKQLAKDNGIYSMANISEVTSKQSKFQHWLNDLPKTVIIDGIPKFKDFIAIKSLISEDKIGHERKGEEVKIIDMPIFIFCTSDPEPLNFGANDRRFYIIKMGV